MTREEFLRACEWVADGVCEWESSTHKWSKATAVVVTDDASQYRRKPEPKLRPWTQADAIPHLHDLFKQKNCESIFRPLTCTTIGIWFHGSAGGLFFTNWCELFDWWLCAQSASCEFKPCGVMEV